MQEVEHRTPQALDETLRHEWSNLFPVCRLWRCNQRRPRYPTGGLLSPGDGVERRIEQRIEGAPLLRLPGGERFVFAAADAADVPAANTAAELDQIHNASRSSTSHNGRLIARNLRQAILEQVNRVAGLLRELEQLPPGAVARAAALERLRKLLARRAPYTMLIRSCFRHIPQARALFD